MAPSRKRAGVLPGHEVAWVMQEAAKPTDDKRFSGIAKKISGYLYVNKARQAVAEGALSCT